MKIEFKEVPKKQVAYIFHKGSFESIPEIMGEVVGWVMSKNLQVAGPPFGVYYTSPQDVSPDEMEFEVGMPFEGEAEGKGNVRVKNVAAHHVLSVMYKGPYSEVGNVYAAVMEYAVKNQYEPAGAPMEIYLNSPQEVPEEELLTEIQFPVVKR
ncbi:GyrI-like domain-containing protein [Methanobacterium congolense]|uniref:Transcription activator effector binding protein n=1 Tax=Methanobacterium congolense TaxID=118062 RepID=A0A1D3L008_9EURY|nr:GyrI-like domain-containing protein [Methanobacterium congolense]SCG84876.1 Transcription activator effector binding protein [Methanobacterium congolense]